MSPIEKLIQDRREFGNEITKKIKNLEPYQGMQIQIWLHEVLNVLGDMNNAVMRLEERIYELEQKYYEPIPTDSTEV